MSASSSDATWHGRRPVHEPDEEPEPEKLRPDDSACASDNDVLIQIYLESGRAFTWLQMCHISVIAEWEHFENSVPEEV